MFSEPVRCADVVDDERAVKKSVSTDDGFCSVDVVRRTLAQSSSYSQVGLRIG